MQHDSSKSLEEAKQTLQRWAGAGCRREKGRGGRGGVGPEEEEAFLVSDS